MADWSIMLFLVYIVFYIGMGIYQVMAALIRLISTDRKDSHYAIGLKKYLVAVLCYFLGLYFYDYFFEGISIMIYLFFVPWIFSIRYIQYVRLWDRKRKNIRMFDKMHMLNAPSPERVLLNSLPCEKYTLKGIRNKVRLEAIQS